MCGDLAVLHGAAAAAKSRQLCLTLCDPIDGSPPGFPSLGFSSKNTGVGCHFLLQCMKMKSKSEVAQSCPTLYFMEAIHLAMIYGSFLCNSKY